MPPTERWGIIDIAIFITIIILFIFIINLFFEGGGGGGVVVVVRPLRSTLNNI